MPERASKSQRLQYGKEATYGAGATVNKRLLSLTADVDPQVSRKKNFAQGYNFPSSTTLEKDFTEADLGGALMFDEIIVPIAMAFGPVLGVAQTPATAIKFTWDIPISGDIVPMSTKIEKGDTTTAESFVGAVVTDLEFSWDREGLEIGGSIMGQNLNESATLTTAGITTFPQIPMDPAKIGLWIDTTSGGLGGTRMLRAFEGGISFGGLFGQIWPLNDTKASFDGIVSLQPDSESTVTLMADAAGKALLTSLRAGDRRFLRWACKGPIIGAGPATYLFQFDIAIEIVDVDAFDDSDGIYAIPLTFAPMADETWAKAVSIQVVNTQTTTFLTA